MDIHHDEELRFMYDDGIDEVEFPTSVCINTQPHPKHRIAGTWRTECPGYTPPPVPDGLVQQRADALDAIAEIWSTINSTTGFRPSDVRPMLDRIEAALRAAS